MITILMVAALLGLGTWQIHRLHWKNELLAAIAQHLNDPPADLRLDLPQDDVAWRDLHYHPVTLQGQFLGTAAFKLAPRTYEGQVGYQWIVPLRLSNNQIVLVDRGFVPDTGNMIPEANETHAVTGIARVMETQKPFGLPPNIPERGQWTWADLAAMGQATGFARVAPILLYESRDPTRDSYPIGGQVPLPESNNHWHYAATWYALAFILIGVYLMSMSPKNEKTIVEPAKDALDPVAERGLYPEATD